MACVQRPERYSVSVGTHRGGTVEAGGAYRGSMLVLVLIRRPNWFLQYESVLLLPAGHKGRSHHVCNRSPVVSQLKSST